MINLLPAGIKEDISYARRNTQLLNWIIVVLAALSIMFAIILGGLIYMQQSINSYTKQVAEAKQTLQTQQLEQTQKRVEEISGNTKLTVQVLSREILFSKLIRQIGAALPRDSVLETLEITNAQNGIQLNAAATDYAAATQVQLNLQDPKNEVFEKADINSITCTDPNANAQATSTSTSALISKYQCEISLKALFSKNNSYLYITPTAKGGAKP
jgi:hypothetical protein